MIECPSCRYKNKDDALACNLCGNVLRKAAGKGEGPAPGAPAAAPRRGADPNAYLTCFPYKPVRLSPGVECSIGRDKNNDLVLPASVVSRKHSSIRWNGSNYVIKDLESANGTVVNDQPVQESVLKPGDRIKVGTFHIQFIEVPGDDLTKLSSSEASDDEKTVTLDRQAVKTHPTGFSGSIADISLPQILQVLELERKSGVLLVQVDGSDGRIFFTDGHPVHAEFKQAKGEEAVFDLLRRTQGSFRFDGTKAGPAAPIKATIKATLAGLLLEGSRRMDETRENLSSSGKEIE